MCVEAKQLRKPFKSFERETKLLELINLIYNDICDLNNINTCGGKRYFIIFVDHYSKYCYIYWLTLRRNYIINSKYIKLW